MNAADIGGSSFGDPAPERPFGFAGISGVALYLEPFDAAVAFYRRVLGAPAYAEGEGTRAWRLGGTWLTLLRGRSGGPGNVELVVSMRTPAEAERLQAAFVAAGGTGEPPSDRVMFEPVRYCSVTDPFGTMLLIIASRPARP